MAYATDITTNSAARPAGGISAFFAKLAEARKQRAVYRATLRELSTLSNRELDDLGISRSGLKRIAIEAAYGK